MVIIFNTKQSKRFITLKKVIKSRTYFKTKIFNYESAPKSQKPLNPLKGDFEEFVDFQRVPLQGSGVTKLKINKLGLFGADSIIQSYNQLNNSFLTEFSFHFCKSKNNTAFLHISAFFFIIWRQFSLIP